MKKIKDKNFFAMRNEKKSIYSKQLMEVINICDNLFYGDYYTTGKLKTSLELKNDIKSKLIGSFVEFFGSNNEEVIEQRINNTDIQFNYQIYGKNSLYEFLKEICCIKTWKRQAVY